ncbi:unnamed protein product, partial [Gulo gulo]
VAASDAPSARRHLQSRLQHRLPELEKPFKAPHSELSCAPVFAQGVGSTGRGILNDI